MPRARALTAYGTTTRLSRHDTCIAAVGLDHGLALVSTDLDVNEVPALRLIAPDSAEAAGLP